MTTIPQNWIPDALPRPMKCDACQSTAIALENNSILYGKDYGDWPIIWYCYSCAAAVGCHKGTAIPLGKMADRDTRSIRSKAHEAFDPIWKNKKKKRKSRNAAYAWLAEQLKIAKEECHISRFDKQRCLEVISICSRSNLNDNC